ncbi:hypothetical protein [Methanocalculus sp.]|uniref:McrC family protein n=1 Tax=Methanocalculus sp. TaxID=2004547 RepID=UPI0026108641|nr:hypothetical protein [Methanocalculus sp.]MDG6251497.1 hypothetical protein [Methanocalculus sp.]
MSRKVATLFEYVSYRYEPASETDSYSTEENVLYLTEDTLQELEHLNRTKYFLDIGRKTLKPLNYIGVVTVGNLTIQILPKLFKGDGYENNKSIIAGNVLKMLSYAESLPITEIDTADLDTEEFEFFEVFVWLFAKNLAELIKSRQNREYVARSEDLRFIRERIDVRRYTNPAKLHIVPCTFHEFSRDNTLNRTLKYTCHLMSRAVKSSENFRLLKFITNVLEPVVLAPVTLAEVDRIRFTRLNRQFEPFIRICRIFLAHSTLTLRASREETFSLLIPMEKLFEEFIAQVLLDDPAYFFGKRVEIQSQESIGYLAENSFGRNVFKLIPDITVRDGGAISVIDTKYKLLNLDDAKFDVKQPDMYQMHAYVTKIRASSAVLLYPDTDVIEYGTFFFVHTDADGLKHRVPLYIRSVHLSENMNTPKGWAAFRRSLADAVRVIIHEDIREEGYPALAIPKAAGQ